MNTDTLSLELANIIHAAAACARSITIYTPEGPSAGNGSARWRTDGTVEIECDADISERVYSDLESCLEGEAAANVGAAIRCATTADGTWRVILGAVIA